jgi:hypothetical protein
LRRSANGHHRTLHVRFVPCVERPEIANLQAVVVVDQDTETGRCKSKLLL